MHRFHVPSMRRPKFTLRGALAGVALLGVAMAWHGAARRQQALVVALAKSNPAVRIVYDDERQTPGRLRRWINDTLGRDFTSRVVAIELAYPTDAELSIVGQLASTQELRLERAVDVTAAGIAHLAALKSLEQIELSEGWNLDDAAMAELGRMRTLERLTLDTGPRVTAAGVLRLGSLTRLKQLALACADDQARAAITDLGKQLPNCKIQVPAQ